ncbi:MAG: helix-turn-helix domain-containing protein [Bacteroidota bacterium]
MIMITQTQTKPTTTLMTVSQAAEYLGLAVSTLNKWRCHGGGPIFIKMGRAVRYRSKDLDNFIASSSNETTSNY